MSEKKSDINAGMVRVKKHDYHVTARAEGATLSVWYSIKAADGRMCADLFVLKKWPLKND